MSCDRKNLTEKEKALFFKCKHTTRIKILISGQKLSGWICLANESDPSSSFPISQATNPPKTLRQALPDPCLKINLIKNYLYQYGNFKKKIAIYICLNLKYIIIIIDCRVLDRRKYSESYLAISEISLSISNSFAREKTEREKQWWLKT